jgi:MFS family permease
MSAALVVPTALALLLAALPAERRPLAVATQAAMGAAAAAVGPTAGALLIESGSWRWIFFVNFPIGVIMAISGLRVLHESKQPAAASVRPPDPLGVALVAVIPALWSFAIIEGPSWGWDHAGVLASLVLAALLVPALVVRTRVAETPALDGELLRMREFRLVNAATLTFSTAFYGVLLGNIVFLQTVWGYSVLEAALATAPGPVVVMIVARFSSRITALRGVRPVLLAGATAWFVACVALATTIGSTPGWATHWLPPALLLGLAIGLTIPVQSAAAAAVLPAARFGVGSAINASSRQLGAVIGVSLFVALVGDTRTATANDYQRAWWVFAVIGIASGLMMLRYRPSSGDLEAAASTSPRAAYAPNRKLPMTS